MRTKTIVVETARSVPNFLRRTASDGGWRVVIIDEAETLNRNAQNALLKILEEPPAKALLILVTQAVGALIPDGVRLQLDLPPGPGMAGRITRDWVSPLKGGGKT